MPEAATLTRRQFAAAVRGMLRRPKPIVHPFTIIADNREQCPWTFGDLPEVRGRRQRVTIDKQYLVTGDYSISGHEDRFTIERKSLEDLYSTLGQNRDRFEREFQRMQEMRFASVVVEASWLEVLDPTLARPAGDWLSNLHPASVAGTITAWSIRYPWVHWWFPGGRRRAELLAWELVLKFWREAKAASAAMPETNEPRDEAA